MMIILDAQQFGLSQLHQLRGRMGDAPSKQSICMAISSLGHQRYFGATLGSFLHQPMVLSPPRPILPCVEKVTFWGRLQSEELRDCLLSVVRDNH